MRSTFFALGLVLAPMSASADAIFDAISDQLGAFAAQDVDRAFGYASPMIQSQFRTPEVFGSMVANGYPPIWNNDGAAFPSRMEQPGRVRQTVIITGRDGTASAWEYDMIQTEAGWKINGVRPIPMPGLNV